MKSLPGDRVVVHYDSDSRLPLFLRVTTIIPVTSFVDTPRVVQPEELVDVTEEILDELSRLLESEDEKEKIAFNPEGDSLRAWLDTVQKSVTEQLDNSRKEEANLEPAEVERRSELGTSRSREKRVRHSH